MVYLHIQADHCVVDLVHVLVQRVNMWMDTAKVAAMHHIEIAVLSSTRLLFCKLLQSAITG